MNSNFFTTIKDNQWSLVHKRCLSHNGDIVDLGCLGWDWSKIFIGNKRVIGSDPQEKQVHGTLLFNGAVSDYSGYCQIISTGIDASIERSSDGSLVLSWQDFIDLYRIDSISVLKVNIEGSEYNLIQSLTPKHFSKIDQIAISFHHFIHPEWWTKTEECLEIIRDNDFETIDLGIWGWYLCLNRKHT